MANCEVETLRLLWENTAAKVAQHAEFPGAARAFMAQPRVCDYFWFYGVCDVINRTGMLGKLDLSTMKG